jgi:hypothetical protein
MGLIVVLSRFHSFRAVTLIVTQVHDLVIAYGFQVKGKDGRGSSSRRKQVKNWGSVANHGLAGNIGDHLP